MAPQTVSAQYIFYFAAVKRSHGAPPSATSHGEREREWESSSPPLPASRAQSQPSLDVRGRWGAARNAVPSPLIHYGDASTSPIFLSRPGTNGLLQGTVISGSVVKHRGFIRRREDLKPPCRNKEQKNEKYWGQKLERWRAEVHAVV